MKDGQILPKGGLEKKLKKGNLKIKLGMDPTAPDLHLGHAVVLSKLKEFQDLGHEIIFLIGDFTAKIGDPTGRSKTRPSLSDEEIKINAKTYFDQVGKILDIKKTKIVYNSEWLSKLSLEDFIKISGKVTLARIIERDDFQNRLKKNISIGFHELFYPIMQGYDSVKIEADVEIGGTDQTFNLIMGRFLQEQFGQDPQVVITMPLLEGLDGTQKMSKSLNNYISLQETGIEAYSKLMSISDKLMWRYFLLLTDKSESEIKKMQDQVNKNELHPMDLKKDMAFAIVKRYWSEKDAESGKSNFESLFQKRDYSNAKEVTLTSNPIWIVELLKQIDAVKSSSDAKRLILDGAVSITDWSVADKSVADQSVDENIIKDFKAEISWKSGSIIKVGKYRIYRIK